MPDSLVDRRAAQCTVPRSAKDSTMMDVPLKRSTPWSDLIETFCSEWSIIESIMFVAPSAYYQRVLPNPGTVQQVHHRVQHGQRAARRSTNESGMIKVVVPSADYQRVRSDRGIAQRFHYRVQHDQHIVRQSTHESGMIQILLP